MPIVNYLRVIGCEHDAANLFKSYMKDHQYGKMKLMKAYLYTNQLKQTSKNDIALALMSRLEVHGAIEW